MKGPHERLKYDLRRVWECPVCKRRERTAGTVTFRHCQCRMKQIDGQPVVMKLVEDGVQRLSAPLIVRHENAAVSATEVATKDISVLGADVASTTLNPEAPH